MSFRLLRHAMCILWSCLVIAVPGVAISKPTHSIARLDVRDGQTVMLVDSKPFIMLGGELYNSSASSTAYLDLLWSRLKATQINTLLVNINWQQFEPSAGKFDYTHIDYLIARAEKEDLRLVVLWFASWKNGESSYVPMWVREDRTTYPRVRNKQGKELEMLSVFGQQTLAADRRAYVALSKRIRDRDRTGRVIMMQVQNEVGILGQDFDYSPLGATALNAPVPTRLLDYMVANQDRLRPELRNAWMGAGAKRSGTWTDVFGDNLNAREFSLAWSYASYMNEIASAGRQVLDLPTFVNAWIVQHERELPGEYPAGGPVSRVMDIYKVAAPKIDLMTPDIYLPDFKSIVGDYKRADNPLFVPESTFDPGRAFYALGQHCALGYSPFGIDDGYKWPAFIAGYSVLREMLPFLAERKCSDQTSFGILRQGTETAQVLELNDMTLHIRYPRADVPAYGMVVRTGRDEFFVAGTNMIVEFKTRVPDQPVHIAEVYDGHFVRGKWVPERLLNGDDTFHNVALRVYGRQATQGPTFAADKSLPPQPTIASTLAASASTVAKTEVSTPGIYRVRLYRHTRAAP